MLYSTAGVLFELSIMNQHNASLGNPLLNSFVAQSFQFGPPAGAQPRLTFAHVLGIGGMAHALRRAARQALRGRQQEPPDVHARVGGAHRAGRGDQAPSLPTVPSP